MTANPPSPARRAALTDAALNRIPDDRYVLKRIVSLRLLVDEKTGKPAYTWKRIANLLGCDVFAVRRWHAEAISIIEKSLAQDPPMTDLLSRLQAATEGSAELDAEVLRAAGWKPARTRGFGGYWRDPVDGVLRSPPNPTRSLDAIGALIEARGWDWFRGPRMSNGVPMGVDAKNDVAEWFVHPSTPIALCIAFVRALEAQEGGA